MRPDIHKLQVGDFTCTIFNDFQFIYQAKDYFINAETEELDTALRNYDISTGSIPSPYIALLVETENRKMLIDSGIGFSETPISFKGKQFMLQGRLHSLLQKQGISGMDITDVVLTHFHPDHIGGVYSDAGQLNFPNAQFHVHEDEWNYWHSSQSDQQPGLFKSFVEKKVSPLARQDLHLMRGDEAEILPGITGIKAAGHTPGQIAVLLHQNQSNLLYISDAFLHPLHIEQLDWQTNYDLDHKKARKSRVKLLEMARKADMQINAFHFDFPGIGRVDLAKGQWKWQYTTE